MIAAPKPSRRRIAVALAVAAAVAATLGVAARPAAATTVAWHDCTLSVSLSPYSSGSSMDMRAAGGVNCGARHSYTQVTVTLKRGGSIVRADGTTFTNSYGMGSRLLYTGDYWTSNSCAVIDNFQGLLQVEIGGLGSTYITTGSPDWYCV